MKPMFSDKIQNPGNITVLEDYELVSDDEKISKILNDYFVNVTAALEIAQIEKTNKNKNKQVV